MAYLRSVFLQPNHAIFDVQKLPAAEYALSIGLPTAPKLRFLKNAGKHVKEVFHLAAFFATKTTHSYIQTKHLTWITCLALVPNVPL